jgi:FKBP12-rapamycin complex-associated protein
MLRNHVVAAVQGFVNAISVGTRSWSASVQQDLLNLLSCLFNYGGSQDIASVVNESIGGIAIEAWLGVLPQLLARIHIRDPAIRSVLHPLLTRLGEKHSQALMYPLAVLVKSPVAERKYAAESLMTSLKSHSSELVEEALLVSSELIRVAILWLETWHEGLEDASRLWFGEQNVSGMLELLIPLHEKLERGADTKKENDFLQSFGDDLAQAHTHVKEYISIATAGGHAIPRGPAAKLGSSGRLSRQMEEAESAMNKAWDIYYTVFRRINKQLPSLTKLELAQCSPALSRARSLELGVPGSYRVDGSYVKIEKFIPNVQVITSKQRPRKITLRGSDGKDYVFLLKGHEDLRQDERVMQLFGLVNALLARDPQTKKHDLSIQRYAISPLSHNCGLVGWVPHCDTFHSLIRDYRVSKKIPLNMENREMLKLAPDYDYCSGMQKVEVFTEALQRTTGQGDDLYEILWLKSTNSEEWLDRRTKFTRSLAVMSMVGYILGLGDRHPSNLMLDKLSGRVLHIDFGDCFEVAMNRDKFPEKVPFRLTRMLIQAMEVAGIEGSYRSTCERTMTVLRDSRDSLVAMLEAFVHDPLISWRLAGLSEASSDRPPPPSTAGNANKNPLQQRSRRHMSDASPLLAQVNEEERLQEQQHGEGDKDDDDDDDQEPEEDEMPVGAPRTHQSRARSLQMYANIQTMAANLPTDDRIQSIGGGANTSSEADVVMSSSTRSRRSSLRHQHASLLKGAHHEAALNEKALKVIQRVEAKLSGTEFKVDEPADVPDQVQRLIVQATNSETLCQLYIGWCAFW